MVVLSQKADQTEMYWFLSDLCENLSLKNFLRLALYNILNFSSLKGAQTKVSKSGIESGSWVQCIHVLPTKPLRTIVNHELYINICWQGCNRNTRWNIFPWSINSKVNTKLFRIQHAYRKYMREYREYSFVFVPELMAHGKKIHLVCGYSFAIIC